MTNSNFKRGGLGSAQNFAFFGLGGGGELVASALSFYNFVSRGKGRTLPKLCIKADIS